jgi:hypothetical protein
MSSIISAPFFGDFESIESTQGLSQPLRPAFHGLNPNILITDIE